MVTLMPTGPLVDAKLVIVGELTTVNVPVLVAVPPDVVTLSGPVVAPAGTVAWIAVADVTVKAALTPLNVTAVAPVKFVPLMVTLLPTGPLLDAKLAIVGAPRGSRPPRHESERRGKGLDPTSPVRYEPSVVNVNWDTPFRNTSRVFPSAVNLHLSPVTMVAVKTRTPVKLPSGFIL